jgi:RNA polymerase sigma-70 factor (ECF subfamily)
MDEELLGEQLDPSPFPEQEVDVRRRRALLDQLLEALPLPLRTVFVLFELEGLPTAEIGPMLGIPVGTVASRLRRARALFMARAKRLHSKRSTPGGGS